jgi:hypothetical protein
MTNSVHRSLFRLFSREFFTANQTRNIKKARQIVIIQILFPFAILIIHRPSYAIIGVAKPL